jgi:hypothetical protein
MMSSPEPPNSMTGLDSRSAWKAGSASDIAHLPSKLLTVDQEVGGSSPHPAVPAKTLKIQSYQIATFTGSGSRKHGAALGKHRRAKSRPPHRSSLPRRKFNEIDGGIVIVSDFHTPHYLDLDYGVPRRTILDRCGCSAARWLPRTLGRSGYRAIQAFPDARECWAFLGAVHRKAASCDHRTARLGELACRHEYRKCNARKS